MALNTSAENQIIFSPTVIQIRFVIVNFEFPTDTQRNVTYLEDNFSPRKNNSVMYK